MAESDPRTNEPEEHHQPSPTSKKRNACKPQSLALSPPDTNIHPPPVSELMSPKPKKPQIATSSHDNSSNQKAALKQFGEGLGVYLANPAAYGSQVVSTSPDFVVIHDLFPKSQLHLLILPRDPSKFRLHPFAAFNDPVFLKSCRDEATKIKALDASELRRRFGRYSLQDQTREKALDPNTTPSPDSTLPPGRDWSSELLVGIHAHPSMSHLHIHVISKDRFSDALKHRKHYNSFSTPFFIPLDDFPLSEGDVRRHPGKEGYLKSDFVCWRCGKGFGNRFKALKDHLAMEFEEWKRE